MAPAPPRLRPDDPRLAGRHLLALADDVDAEEVEVLAVSRFPGARWETPVPAAPARGRAAQQPLADVGLLRLSRHSRLAGPFALARDGAVALSLPTGTATAWLVLAPRERGEPPYPGGDREGLKRAFPGGMPVRDEERVLRWLVDAARRLGGAVRTADTDGAAVLVPDPRAAVDLTTWSTAWLDPDAGEAVVRRAAPTARLAMEAARWAGPPDDVGHAGGPPSDGGPVVSGPLVGGPLVGVPPGGVPPGGRRVPDGLGERARRRLHERADAVDAAALAGPDELAGYGIEVDLAADGLVVVEVGGEPETPLVLRGLPWPPDGVVTYRVRWEPPDVEDLEREHATPAHRASRERACGVVDAVIRTLHAVVGGEVTDAADFLVDPADL